MSRRLACSAFSCLFLLFAIVHGAASPACAQLAPEIGYILPAGGAPGTTFDAVIGGYDWSPDMQIFTADPRVKIELLGPPSPVLVPEPPYWFGAKARGPAWPLPREFPARITLAPDLPPGLVRWQVANANGVSPPAQFAVLTGTSVAEDARRRGPQPLPSLPVAVSGQIRRIEEIDAYSFQTPYDGAVTLSVVARQIGSPLHAMLRVVDGQGRTVVDAADTQGRDLSVTFGARAGIPYVVTVHDLDYAGDRSYVYCLSIVQAPRILAAFPLQAKRGVAQNVEFWGWGVATGAAALESTTRSVTIPSDAATARFSYQLETPAGRSTPWTLLVGDDADAVEPLASRGLKLPRLPISVAGSLESPLNADEYQATLAKDATYRIAAQARELGSPLDLDLTLLGPDGKELMTLDDVPGATDPALTFKAPADGEYRIVVADRTAVRSGRGGFYRLIVEPQRPDFTAKLVDRLAVPLGTKVKLPVAITRVGGFKEAVALQLRGLPEGVAAPAAESLVIPADKNELTIELECAADAPATASWVEATAATKIDGVDVLRPLGSLVVAVTLKPRIKITPEGLDDVRKVHRGSTYLAPLLIERLEGYSGPITLEMTSKQQRHRQGLASDEFVATPDATRVEYPIFVPEWMETTKTSRMILNGTVRVADPRGNVRTLVQRMELRIGILPEGALLKVTHAAHEPSVVAGATLAIPVKISRAPEFREPVKIELQPANDEPNSLVAAPLQLNADQTDGQLEVRVMEDKVVRGRRTWTLRASALQDGRWPVASETTVEVDVR